MAVEASPAVNIRLKEATVRSITYSGGKARFSLEVDVDKLTALTSDLNEASKDSFKADVSITGAVEQTTIDWSAPVPKVVDIKRCSACGGEHRNLEIRLYEGRDAYLCPARGVPVWDLEQHEPPQTGGEEQSDDDKEGGTGT